jgi:DHA1 family tetracycline resistance protein-like MFS transporter
VPVASTAGLIVSVGSLVSALAASQIGRLVARRGVRMLLPISLLLGLIGAAPVFLVTGIGQLVALRILFGLAAGTTATLTYAAATDLVPDESRSTAFGFLGSGTSLATAMGPFGAGALATISLRAAFASHALVYAGALALGIAVAVRNRQPPGIDDSA